MAIVTGLYILNKNGKNQRQAEKVAASIQLGDDYERFLPEIKTARLQQVLAMLVDGVYSRDREGMDFCKFVKPFLEQTYTVEPITEHYVVQWTRMEHLKHDEQDEIAVGLRHYLRPDNHPNPVAPRLVIALRGTKLSSLQDIVDDCKIAKLNLHRGNRFKKCQELVENLIHTFRNYYGGEASDICITGHSLGAAIALHIGRDLATKKNERYAVHCFNPPFLTLFLLLQKGFLVEKTKDRIMKSNLLAPILKGASYTKDHAKAALACMFTNPLRLSEELFYFASMKDWVPVLYVNTHDVICKQYLRYYERKHSLKVNPISTQALVSRMFGRNAKYSSLVPSVDMHISERPKWPHELKQWYTDRALLMPRRQEFRLMAIMPPSWFHGLSIITLAATLTNIPLSDLFQGSDSDSDDEDWSCSHHDRDHDS